MFWVRQHMWDNMEIGSMGLCKRRKQSSNETQSRDTEQTSRETKRSKAKKLKAKKLTREL